MCVLCVGLCSDAAVNRLTVNEVQDMGPATDFSQNTEPPVLMMPEHTTASEPELQKQQVKNKGRVDTVSQAFY